MGTEGTARDDLYRVLGLEPRASRAQIERAYRFHVELYGEDGLVTSTLLGADESEQQRVRLREAYDVLSDPQRRREYDRARGYPPPDLPASTPTGAEPPEPASPPLSPGPDDPVTFAEPRPVSAEVAEPGLAALLAPASAAFEALRVLRTKVHALDAERPARCLGLVSATAGEGASAVAAGLAAALAQERERRVLLLEARLHAPALERSLGLAAEPGLREWLEGSAQPPLPVRRVEPWGFDLLPAGAPLPRPSELLGTGAFRRLLVAARESFDFVLVDCPPLEPAADAAVIQGVLDGLLLVVRARHAARGAVRAALARLEAGAVRGVVFNDRTEILARWLDRRRSRAAPS